ncbi:MAG: 5-formyltetrahydrofolate cyclo-ligase [Thermoplasmatota archaeon]
MRTQLRQSRAGIKTLMRAQEEDLVNAMIVSDPDWQEARTVLVYKAVGTELSVVSATNEALRRGIRVCFPRVGPSGLSLHQVTDWAQLEPGVHGIPEPAASCPVVSPTDVDVALVPGLGFTSAGQRLGQGGGHYDRLLPTLGGVSWGVAFSVQVVPELPVEAHDRPVDRVVQPP